MRKTQAFFAFYWSGDDGKMKADGRGGVQQEGREGAIGRMALYLNMLRRFSSLWKASALALCCAKSFAKAW